MTILMIVASVALVYFLGLPIVNAIDNYMKYDNN